MADVFVSWAYLQTAPATVLRSASAAQTVGAFPQTATAVRITSAVTEVSFASLQIPDTALPTRNITGTQQVGAFTQSASLSDIIGQINGGGTITEQLPHRSIGGTQSVGTFQQSAAGGSAGALAPRLASAIQTVGAFGQVAVADAQAAISAAQQVQPFGQLATIGDPPPPPVVDNTVTGGYASDGQRYKTRVKGRTIYADSYDSLRRKVLALDDDEPPRKRAPRIVRARPVKPEPPDPTAAVRAEMQAQMAKLQRQMAELMQQRVTDEQQMQQAYEARIANAESSTRAALALATKAQRDMQALAALLTE